MILKIHGALYHGQTATEIVRSMSNEAEVGEFFHYMEKVKLNARMLGIEIKTDSTEEFVESLIDAKIAENVPPESL